MRNYFTLLAFGISTLNADRARPHDGTSCPCLAGRPPRNNRRRGSLLDDEGLPEKRAHSLRGLRALRQPRLDGGGVQVRLLFDRVVPSKLLLVKRREGERGERRVPRRLSSSSAAFHVLIRPSSVPRERAKWGGFSVAGGRGTYLQGGTVATLAGVDSDDAVERRANAAEAREANLRREGGGSTVRQRS